MSTQTPDGSPSSATNVPPRLSAKERKKEWFAGKKKKDQSNLTNPSDLTPTAQPVAPVQQTGYVATTQGDQSTPLVASTPSPVAPPSTNGISHPSHQKPNHPTGGIKFPAKSQENAQPTSVQRGDLSPANEYQRNPPKPAPAAPTSSNEKSTNTSVRHPTNEKRVPKVFPSTKIDAPIQTPSVATPAQIKPAAPRESDGSLKRYRPPVTPDANTTTTAPSNASTQQQRKESVQKPAQGVAKPPKAKPSTQLPAAVPAPPPVATKPVIREADQSARLYQARPIQHTLPTATTASTPPASSPVLSATASPARAPLDINVKKQQAATLFSLMSAAKGSAQKHKSVGGGQKSKAGKVATVSSVDDGLGNLDLSALINRSQQEQAKQREQTSRIIQEQTRMDDDVPVGGENHSAGMGMLDALLGDPNAPPPAAVPEHVPTPAEEFLALYDRTKADEQSLHTLLSQQAKMKSSTSISDESRMRIAQLRKDLRTAYLNLLTNFPSHLAVQKNLVSKLWMNVYKEMEPLLDQAKERVDKALQQHQQHQPPSGSTSSRIVRRGGPQASTTTTPAPFNLFTASLEEERSNYFERIPSLLEQQFEMFDALSEDINRKYQVFGQPAADARAAGTQMHSNEDISCARQLLSALCVCLGDLDRYRQQYVLPAASAATPGQQNESDWSRCIFFYTRSLLLDPSSSLAGKSHNQLALVASLAHRSDTTGARIEATFEALYHYTRALHTPSNPFPARENILSLYEENRAWSEDILKKVAANHAPKETDMQVFLCLFVRLLSILDTHIGEESFERTCQICLGDKFKSVLNQDWFHPSSSTSAFAASSSSASTTKPRVLTELHALKLMMLCMQMVETHLTKDAESAVAAANNNAVSRQAAVLTGLANRAASNLHDNQDKVALIHSAAPVATATTPFPFSVNQRSLQAMAILYELFGLLARMPGLVSRGSIVLDGVVQADPSKWFNATGTPVPFLPALTMVCTWVHSRWPWAMIHPELADDQQAFSTLVKPVEYARVGLAQLANLLELILDRSSDPSSLAVPPHSSVSLLELDGFKPLMACGLWPFQEGRESVDSFHSQARKVVSFARQVLFSHPSTNRLSALPPPPSALSTAEQEALMKQQEQWAANAARRKLAQSNPAQAPAKKRASKQAKPRPWLVEQLHETTGDNDDEAGIDDGSSSSHSQCQTEEDEPDAESSTITPGLPVQSSIRNRTSALEGMISDANLGLPTASSAAASPASTSPHIAAIGATPLSLSSTKPLLLLDAPNIAMTHGKHHVFSTRGIELAIEFFHRRGFRVLAFIPESYLDYEAAGKKRRAIKAGFEVKVSSLPDNIGMLHAWRKEGILTTTPSADYDDSYVCEYGMSHSNALIISNDRYRDHARDHGANHRARGEILDWLRDHVISYTFIGDEFHMNPDWKFDTGVGLRKIVKQHQHQHQHGQHSHQHGRAGNR